MLDAAPVAGVALFAVRGQQGLCLGEGVGVDEGFVGGVGGGDPGVLGVPDQCGGVAERDVVDVEEAFVFALPVPDLVAGVAGVGEDGADGGFGPGGAAAVFVACGVVGRGAGDALAGQFFGQ
nr:hypothetical protein [Saccharomonospora amisosensis]